MSLLILNPCSGNVPVMFRNTSGMLKRGVNEWTGAFLLHRKAEQSESGSLLRGLVEILVGERVWGLMYTSPRGDRGVHVLEPRRERVGLMFWNPKVE